MLGSFMIAIVCRVRELDTKTTMNQSRRIMKVRRITAESPDFDGNLQKRLSGESEKSMIRITITNNLTSLWATDEQFADMPDEEIVALVREDMLEFANDATWTVERDKLVGVESMTDLPAPGMTLSENIRACCAALRELEMADCALIVATRNTLAAQIAVMEAVAVAVEVQWQLPSEILRHSAEAWCIAVRAHLWK